MTSFLGQSGLPRGIRNNNPGNLVRTAIKWDGKIPHSQSTDTHFEQFESIEHGIRAKFLDLLNDYHVDGNKTVKQLISEFAPAFENNTEAYISYVAKAMNVLPNVAFTPTKRNFVQMAMAINDVENSKYELDKSIFETAWDMVPVKKKRGYN